MTQLENQAKRGMVDPETYEFLRKDGGQRVEINAIASAKVGEYLETKLEERGVDKIAPDPDDVDTPDVDSWDETRDQAVHRAIGEFIDDQLNDDLVETLADVDERIGLPDESDRPAVDDDETSVCHAVREALADRPPKSWKDVNQDVVDERKSELEQAQDEFAGDVRDAVHDLIQKDGFVEVSPPDVDD